LEILNENFDYIANPSKKNDGGIKSGAALMPSNKKKIPRYQ